MRAPASHRFPGVRTLLGAMCLVLAGTVAGCAEPKGQVDVAAASAAAAVLTSPVDGQVVKLESEGLTKVRGFVLRTDDGQEIAFSIGVLENGAEFPPSHLAEHMATGTPVRISFRDQGGVPVVYRIEDAPGS
jgi:hypothetical protein